MTASSIWIKDPLAVHAQGAERGVVVQGSRIIELVGRGQHPQCQPDEIYDASNAALIPGLINTHHHFYQTLTRAYPSALNKELFPWLKNLYLVWQGIDDQMLELASTLAIAELLLSGCTTVSDHHYIFSERIGRAIDIQVAVAKKIGVRAHLTRGSMNLGEEDGGLPPQSVVQTHDQILEDSERVIQNYHQRNDGAMVQIALAPCSPFSVTTELMRDTAVLAEKEDVLLHTHLAETLDEEQFCQQKFGMRTVDYLEHVNWLNNRTWLAHGIHFDDHEIARLGKAGVGISHCPSSNMMLASGICQSLALQKAGCRFGLGVDGSASNDCSNMIGEVRMAMYLQRLKYGASNITHLLALDWATSGSADLLKRTDIGRLKLGAQADLALFRLDEIEFSGSHDALAALLLCGARRADRVMVAGNWLVTDGQLTSMDTSELIYQHTQAAKKLAHATCKLG